MKRTKIFLVSLVVIGFIFVGCDDTIDHCVHDVYQNATIIDQECLECYSGDFGGESVYYINTNVVCTP